MKTYVRGTTARIEADFTDGEDDPAGPTSVSSAQVTIYNPDGAAVVTNGSMTATAITGTYYYAYAIPIAAPLGFYKAVCSGVVGAHTGQHFGEFEVVAQT